jgi:DNA-directed RNA polymerase specialized sigma24 family protein
MVERANVEEADALLLPFLKAEGQTASQNLLTELIEAHAVPMINVIIGQKLRVSVNGARATHAAQEAEDVRSEILLQLISRLNALKTEDEGRAIANFRSYVAVTTHNACHEFLRRKYPGRWRLKNRLRYLLTHRSDFALWEGEEGDWLCGLETARGQKRIVSAGRVDELRNDPQASKRLGLEGRNAQLMNPAELLRAIFQSLGGAVGLDDLVSLVSELQGVKDRAPEYGTEEEMDDEGDPYENLADSRTDVATEIEQRRYVEHLWREICGLPQRQRTALLLNLRDDRGGDVIALFPMLGVASIRQIAEVLGLPAEEFAALWHDLPLDDASIAGRLGLSRQQVINLRKSARERLARRMKEF